MNRANQIARIITFFVIFFPFGLYEIYAQSSTTIIDATVKISICGNEIIEGGEDCEGSNLNNQTCQSVGYGPGNLTCDIACTYDVTNCLSPSPTPSPIPTIIPTLTPTEGVSPSLPQLDSISPSPYLLQSPILQPSVSISPRITELRPLGTELPESLQYFDFRGIGKILLSDLTDVVAIWVDGWRNVLREDGSKGAVLPDLQKCDMNNDGLCNLTDFSILMSYIES